ncbi:MAG: methionyl-tRNA formyltransferase [Alphaproteobacteria bacterium]|nr:methionyl-tRNA formyltransferase [Alphaproteobacteria bacterium]
MKLVLMGTNDFVVPIFDAVRTAGHEIVAVFTRAPKPVGRKQVLTPSPVHQWADAHGLNVHTNIGEYNYNPDMIVVVSYGVILRDNVLKSAPCVNIHPSSLPQYRGPSPIRTAIFNGDASSAVCLMQVTAEMDAGDVYMRRAFDIGENDTNADVERRVSEIGAEMLIEYLSRPGDFPPVPQSGDVTFTRKFAGADEIIDWTRSARDIHNQVRALGAGRTKINGMDVKILQTRVHDGKLDILTIQPAGKKPMDWKSFVNGQRGADIKIGE